MLDNKNTWSNFYTVSTVYLWIPHPGIQPTTDQKHSKQKIPSFLKMYELSFIFIPYSKQCNSYLQSISIVLGICNLHIISSTCVDGHKLYANTMPFCTKDLSLSVGGYPQGVQERSLKDFFFYNNVSTLCYCRSLKCE